MISCDGLSGAVLIASPDGKVGYWSPAAASKFGWSDTEARELGIQGLISTEDGAPASRRVKMRTKNGTVELLEAQIIPLADAGSGVYGHLFVLRAVESGEKASHNSGHSFMSKGGSAGGQILHQLNNVFTKIVSSLDLALVKKEHTKADSLLMQAQESAWEGAGLVNELRKRVGDLPGLAGPKTGFVEPKAAGHPAHLANPSPELLEGSERVLLAEDDKSIRDVMRAVLTYRGYKVVEAVDGADAVNKHRAGGPFDLVILDMTMPTLGGREALEQIRAQDSAARALALSGTPFDSEDNPRNPAAKFDGVLNKPFGNIELLQTVRRILDHQRVTDLRSAVSGSPARSFGTPQSHQPKAP